MKKYFLFVSILFAFGCGGNENENIINASGTIETTEVNLASKSPGQIIYLRVDEGTVIHQGDTIAVTDTTNYALNYRQALAAAAQAEAQFELQQHGSRREDIEQAADQVKQAEANFKNAKDDEARMKDLLAANAATRKQYEDAATKRQTMEAALNVAKDALNKLQNGARTEDIAAAKAHLEQLQGQANTALQSLHDCIVISPVNGTVTHKVLNQGEMAGPNATIVTISVIDPVKLTIYISDKDLGKVKVGEKAEVKIDTYKDRTFPGSVIYISPDAEFTPKNVQTTEERSKLVFAVKIQVPNADGTLKPGMPADAALHVK
jgi:HlyD family secretion protein